MNFNDGIAREGTVAQGKTYRITVLTERLLRLEYNKTGVFYDNPSQFAINRKFPKPEFTLKQDDRFLEITTKYFSLSYEKEKNFDAGKLTPMANLKIQLNGTDKSWYVHNAEVKTLNGLNTSEDGDPKNQRFSKSLYSLDGYASFHDSNTYLYNASGNLIPREQNYMDIYLFMYGNDFEEALKDYYTLVGYPPLIPRYALGNWWSRDLPYTSEQLLELVNHFKMEDIPLSVLLLEKDWHMKRTDVPFSETGFTFNHQLIPDESQLLQQLHEKNIRVGLSINPKDGIAATEEQYPNLANAFQITGGKTVQFDPMNQTVLKAMNTYMLTPLLNKGVDFLANDYQDFLENIQRLWFVNDSLFQLLNKEDRRGLLLARNAHLVPHRYPSIYTGKTLVSWDSLKRIPLLNQNAANIGVGFISSDIAGNHGGMEEDELYIRSVQLACFSPILRFSAPSGKYYRKEPWRWNIKTSEVVKEYLNLRHALIPYLYTESYHYKEGVPLVRPLYYQEPFVIDDSNFKNEYYLGSSLLICPILHKQDPLIKRTIHKFYLPEGVWYNLRSGKKFPGKKEYISFFEEVDYPVFVKSGAIIPMSYEEGKPATNPKDLEFHIFPGQSNSYLLYEDDGLTKGYEKGDYLKTQIDYQYTKDQYQLVIRAIAGKGGIVPETRNYKIRFRNTKTADEVIAYVNNTMVKPVISNEDADFILELENVPSTAQVSIVCKGNQLELDAIRLINDEIDGILLDAPMNTVLKEKISAIMFSNLAIKRKRIEVRRLQKVGLTKEHMRLFLRLLEYIEQI